MTLRGLLSRLRRRPLEVHVRLAPDVAETDVETLAAQVGRKLVLDARRNGVRFL